MLRHADHANPLSIPCPCGETQTMSHIDKTEWRLISATLCRWKHCFVADQLWFMTRIREEEEAECDCLNLLIALIVHCVHLWYDAKASFSSDILVFLDPKSSKVTRRHSKWCPCCNLWPSKSMEMHGSPSSKYRPSLVKKYFQPFQL